jgi:hypothetical protein
MRSCPSGFFPKFFGFFRTYLSCFGAPRRDPVLPEVQTASGASLSASSEFVFVSPVLTFGINSPDSNLTISLNEEMRVSSKIDQGTQTEMPETQTQGTQAEAQLLQTQGVQTETQTEAPETQMKNQIVEKLEREPEREPEQEQENECLQGSSNHSTPIPQADDSASEEQDINSPPCKSEGYEVLSPLLSQQHSTSIGLQDFSDPPIPIHQTYDSASGEQEINSPRNWESGEFKMLSPFLYQNHSTLEGLQDSYSSLKTHDSDSNDSAQYLKSRSSLTSSLSSIPNQYSQLSGGSFYNGIKTNFFQSDKTKEQTLNLLQNASTDAVNGVSDFSSLMDSITQDLKKVIEDPLYSSKSISLGLQAKSSLPSSSPSPSSSHIAPKVLVFTVLGKESNLIIC